MNAQVQLKINEQNLIKHLKLAFASSTTYLSELMQNARRAGASQVSFDYDLDAATLVISDDGCGITDLQTILTVAESGWDQDVVDTEHPYGIGFLSALFAANHVCIESKGQCIDFDTKTILNFGAVPIKKSDIVMGTKLTLSGILEHPGDALKRFAKGYPIDIHFNGQSLPRFHALNGGLSFQASSLGHCFIYGIKSPVEKGRAEGTNDIVVYLQGIEVYATSSVYVRNGNKVRNIIHLDPRQYYGNLPDRTSLINEEEVIDEIRHYIKNQWANRLKMDVSTLPENIVAEQYYLTFKYWDQLALLNDIPFIPTEILGAYDIYPVINQDWEDTYSIVNTVVSRTDMELGITKVVKLLDDQSCIDGPFQVLMYAYLHNTVALTRNLSDGHWANNLVIPIGVDDVDLNIEQPVHETNYCSNWLSCNVLFCEKVTLSGPLGDTTNIEDAFFAENCFVHQTGSPLPYHEKGAIIVPSKECRGDVVRQCTSFTGEHDEFSDSEQEKEQALFENFIMSQRPNQECLLLHSLLEGINLIQYDCLSEKTFKVTLHNKINASHKSHYEIELLST